PVAPAAMPVAAPAGKSATIQIVEGAGVFNSENTYSPKSLTIKRGTTVTWMNNDPNMVHNLAGEKHTFQSTYMRTGQSWSYSFRKPGVYRYTCLPHPWMKGEITVQ